MDIGYIWNASKYAEVQAMHGVRFDEVVSVFEDVWALELADPQGHEDRVFMVGCSRGGRVLSVIYSEVSLPIYRIITAFEASAATIDEYKRRFGH